VPRGKRGYGICAVSRRDDRLAIADGWIQIATFDDVAGFVALGLGDELPPPQCVSKSAPSATQSDRVTLISVLLAFALGHRRAIVRSPIRGEKKKPIRGKGFQNGADERI